MVRAAVITLIGDSPNAHGVFDSYTVSKRDVPCVETQIRRANLEAAQAIGLNCEHVVRLALADDYQHERRCTYDGIEYTIAQVYRDASHNWVDLTLARGVEDA